MLHTKIGRVAYVVALVALTTAFSAFSADRPALVTPGRWEVTLRNELPYATEPVTYSICIDTPVTAPEPPKGKPSDPCQIVSGGVAGNVLSYTSRCGDKKASEVRITYHGDRYEGIVELTEPSGTFRQVISAKRVGACDGPHPQPSE